MELLQLKYFKDAAKHENFTAAAKENFVPQPSISKAIKNLEEELKVPLFDRRGKKIFLNENGRYLYDNVTKIFTIIDECKVQFSYYKSNTIKLYIQDGMFFISKLVADFTFENYDIAFNYLSVSEVMQANKAPYDFTFMPLVENMNDYTYETLLKDDLVVLVSDKHPFARKKTVKLQDLKDEKFISYYNTISHRVLSDRLLIGVGQFEPQYIFETHDENAVLHLVSQNEGITISPEKLYNSRPYENIKAIKLDKTIQSELVIAWDKYKTLTYAEKLFLEFTKNWFKKI